MTEPADTRRIRNSSIRYGSRPRWVALYEGSPHGGAQEGRRRVGLLVPRPTLQSPNGHSQIAYSHTGELTEFPVGFAPTGSPGAWWTARASELPREQWQAIRAFYADPQRTA
jgi:hypothetical protein